MTYPPGQPPGWWQPPGDGRAYPPAPAPSSFPQTPSAGGPVQPGPHREAPSPAYGGSFRSEYGGLGAFDGQQTPKRRRRRTRILTGGAIALALGGAGAAAWLLGAFQGDVLDQDSLQNGVITVLRDNFGEHDVSNARCPDSQPARNGTTFECTVEISGQQKTVPIRVLNEKPEVEVGAPR